MKEMDCQEKQEDWGCRDLRSAKRKQGTYFFFFFIYFVEEMGGKIKVSSIRFVTPYSEWAPGPCEGLTARL